jgi:mannose-1-phosphate guanylyltransferase
VRTPADKLVVIRGLDDFIVVDENNVLLIYPKNKEQEIKQVTTTLKQLGKTDKL